MSSWAKLWLTCHLLLMREDFRMFQEHFYLKYSPLFPLQTHMIFKPVINVRREISAQFIMSMKFTYFQ